MLVIPKEKKVPQILLNGKQPNEENKPIVLEQSHSHILNEGDAFSLLVDLTAKLTYRIQVLKTPKVQNQQQDHLNVFNKSAPPSPRKIEMDSPGNKRKNDNGEENESPTKQIKNFHQNQNAHNTHHDHHNNNHQSDGYYNSEDEEEDQQNVNQQHTTQNNNMDDYVGGNDNKDKVIRQ